MTVKEMLRHLNTLRGRALGGKVKEYGSNEVVIYNTELTALDEAIELLKEMNETD